MHAVDEISTRPAAKAGQPLAVPRGNQIAEALILAFLISVPALICLHRAAVSDPDVWWHLRTGEWIVQHRAVPRTDPFSAYAAGKPWQAYSWLFELLVFKCFERLGLGGLVAYTTAMVLAITTAIYHLIRRLQPDFSASALLTLVAGISLMRLFTPRPWLFSILFFTLQLDILMHVRRTGKTRELLWLPVIYALWANVHIQLIDGLLVFALALGEAVLARWWKSARTLSSPAWLGGIFIACVLATLVNPYGWRIYQVAYSLATEPGVLNSISELAPIPFRMWPDFCVLFLALGAAAGLAAPAADKEGEWPRRFPIFEMALLAFAAVVSFRSGRDLWVMVIAAAAIIAQQFSGRKQHRPTAVFTLPIAVAGVAVILFAGVRTMHINNVRLHDQLAKDLPVHAVEVVKQQGYRGPLFNDYGWGGYLIWDPRMPVSIDGRAGLDGEKRIQRSLATWGGEPDWASDPDLASAGLVIASVKEPLTQLLRTDSRFQLAYEDKVAAVFIARRLHERPANASAAR